MYIQHKFVEVMMKKTAFYCVMLFIFILIHTGHSQIKVGLIGGLNFADLQAETDFYYKTLVVAGVILEKRINNHFSLQAEPMYLQKGGILPAQNGLPEMHVKGSFIEVPIFIKYSIQKTEKFKPYFIAGPDVGVKLSMDLNAEMVGSAFSADLNPVTKTFDMGFGIGAGIEFPLRTTFLFVEGKYSLGLVDLHKNGMFQISGGGVTIEEEFDEDNKFKTRGFQVMFGAKILLGNKNKK